MRDGVYKWWALWLLWGAYFLDLGSRQIYGATLPAISSTFGVTSAQIGLVGTVFAVLYGVCAPFSGLVSDILSRKWIVTAAVAVFCLGTFLSGFTVGVGSLILTYGVLCAVSQPFIYPPLCSIVTQLHNESRATAVSLIQLALYAGIIICSYFGGWLSDLQADGWRRAFWIVGAVGLLWTAVLVLALRNTKPVRKPDEAERASVGEALKAVFSKPSAIMYCVYFALMIFVFIGYSTWTPTFLKDKYPELTLKSAALHSVLWHYIGAAAGVMIGSRISDRFAKTRKSIRLEVTVFGIVGSIPSIILMVKTPSLAVCCAALCAYGVFRGFFDSSLYVSLLDVIKPRFHATALGLTMGIGYVFGALAPWGLGLIRQHFSIQTGFMIFAWFYALAIVLIFISRAFFLKRDYEG